MRLGVTGRSRTGTGGVTSRSSAIELRPHPNARGDSPQGDAARLGPAFKDVALFRVRQPVGEPAHLDRLILLFGVVGAIGGLIMGAVCRKTHWPGQTLYSVAGL